MRPGKQRVLRYQRRPEVDSLSDFVDDFHQSLWFLHRGGPLPIHPCSLLVNELSQSPQTLVRHPNNALPVDGLSEREEYVFLCLSAEIADDVVSGVLDHVGRGCCQGVPEGAWVRLRKVIGAKRCVRRVCLLQVGKCCVSQAGWALGSLACHQMHTLEEKSLTEAVSSNGVVLL